MQLEIAEQERDLLRRLATRFRSQEERLRATLECSGAQVELSKGGIKQRRRFFAMQDRGYAVEWDRTPQPIALHLRCLRAVKVRDIFVLCMACKFHV